MNAEEYLEVKRKAEAHWAFLERWLQIVYVDAFIHGYKHGRQIVVQKESKEKTS